MGPGNIFGKNMNDIAICNFFELLAMQLQTLCQKVIDKFVKIALYVNFGVDFFQKWSCSFRIGELQLRKVYISREKFSVLNELRQKITRYLTTHVNVTSFFGVSNPYIYFKIHNGGEKNHLKGQKKNLTCTRIVINWPGTKVALILWINASSFQKLSTESIIWNLNQQFF